MSDYTMEELVKNHEKAFKPDAAEGIDAVIQYKLTGDEAGDYIITIKDGACSTAAGDAENPNMTLTADSQDLKDVLLGRANGMQYFMQGKLKLAGDLNLAMKLTTFFKMS